MSPSNAPRLAVDVVYVVGTVICLVLGATALFGSNAVMDPDAMLPFTYRERAFLFLCVGAIPMVAACVGVYVVHQIGRKPHHWRKACLVFLPGAICAACALYAVAILLIGMVNMVLFR